MELIELQDNDLAKFKNLMQESFQHGYERVYGKSNELILSKKLMNVWKKEIAMHM